MVGRNVGKHFATRPALLPEGRLVRNPTRAKVRDGDDTAKWLLMESCQFPETPSIARYRKCARLNGVFSWLKISRRCGRARYGLRFFRAKISVLYSFPESRKRRCLPSTAYSTWACGGNSNPLVRDTDLTV